LAIELADINPALSSPADLLQMHLSVAYYPGPGISAQRVREELWHLHNEGQLAWSAKIFDSAIHLNGVLQSWSPQLLITHWHGDNRNAPSFDLPTQVAQRLRRMREGLNLSGGPYLVGQFSRMDSRFMPDQPNNLINDLLTIYDMLFCEAGLLTTLRNVSIAVWNHLSRAAGKSFVAHPFDVGFRAFL
jgi:hypothetical protein